MTTIATPSLPILNLAHLNSDALRTESELTL